MSEEEKAREIKPMRPTVGCGRGRGRRCRRLCVFGHGCGGRVARPRARWGLDWELVPQAEALYAPPPFQSPHPIPPAAPRQAEQSPSDPDNEVALKSTLLITLGNAAYEHRWGATRTRAVPPPPLPLVLLLSLPLSHLH